MRIILTIILTLFLQTPLWATTCPGGWKIANDVQQFMRNNQIPGAAVAVYIQGKIYYFNYGVADLKTGTPVTKDTLFYIASITKVFTTTLLAEEIENGKIALSDPIVNYIPLLSSTSNLPIDQVDVQNLATYTSSFPREMENFGVAFGNINGLMNAFKRWQPYNPIGTNYLYSNLGFQVLGLVLQNCTGQSYATLLQQNIFTPLSMQNSYIFVPKNKMFERATGYDSNNAPMASDLLTSQLMGSGEIQSSTADLIQFVKANLNNPTNQSTPALLNAMQLAQQSFFQIRDNFDIGLGWFKTSGPRLGTTIYKDGAYPGFSSFMILAPDKQIGVVMLVNKNHQDLEKMGYMILNILATN